MVFSKTMRNWDLLKQVLILGIKCCRIIKSKYHTVVKQKLDLDTQIQCSKLTRTILDFGGKTALSGCQCVTRSRHQHHFLGCGWIGDQMGVGWGSLRTQVAMVSKTTLCTPNFNPNWTLGVWAKDTQSLCLLPLNYLLTKPKFSSMLESSIGPIPQWLIS